MKCTTQLSILLATIGHLTAAELPLLFERHGADDVRVRGNGYAVQLHSRGMKLRTASGTADLEWLGARPARVQPEGAAVSRIHYLTGNQSNWRRNIPAFGRIRYGGLYEGIDVVYYGAERRMEYDFIVKPGADPRSILFELNASLTADGDLALANGLRWKKPVARQDGREVAVRFSSRGDRKFGFDVGAYDSRRELTIDPVLTYSTYLGGSLADDARGVAIDSQGSAYIVGSTVSTDFPGINRGQTFGSQDAFVAKVNASGTALEWATYVGGNGVDTGLAIAVDSAGAPYITGETASTNFPVSSSAPQQRLAGGSGVTDSFAAKLSPNGASIVWATYLGGTASDVGLAIALGRDNTAYVAGRTDSTDFPSTTRDTLPPRGAGDGFITKLNVDGTAFAYSSFLGGFALDTVNAIVVDAQGSVYAAGETRSDNFPVTDGAFQRQRNGASDSFVSKLTPDGTGFVFSSYYGGDGAENARAIGIDPRGAVYFTGISTSNNLPLSFNAAQRAPALLPDAFVAKFDSMGASLVYGTYLGGDADDEAMAIAVDSAGNAYVGGRSSSANFPLRNDGPLMANGPSGGYDGFVTKVTSGGNLFQYSTLIGGTGNDSVYGIAIDGQGRTWMTGATDSANFPTTSGVLGARSAGASDAFVTLMSEILVTISPATVSLGPGESQQFTTTVSNTSNTQVRWSMFPELGTLTQSGLYSAPPAFTGSPTLTVSAISIADGTKIAEAVVTLENRVTISIAPTAVTLGPSGTQQFTATVGNATNTAVTWSLSPQIGAISTNGLYTAPGSIAAVTTVSVRVTSVLDTARFATATVTLQPPAPPVNPEITAAGFTNAASFRGSTAEGGLSAGELITIFGRNMGPASPVTLQLDGRGFVSNRLANTRVLFDGTPGPMILTSSGQVSAVVPYEVEGKQTVQVRVEYEGQQSNAAELSIAASAPGIFTQDSTGQGAASLIRSTGELITPASGAVPGEALTLYATGEGATEPAGVDGKPTTTPLPRPKANVVVLIDGIEVEPLYAGGAPGLVAGVLQVNFIVPQLSSGPKRLQLRVAGKLSPDQVTMQIR